MLRACPHHRFSKLTQIDTFYNGLTEQNQDSLNAASGGNLLNKTTREALKIIKNKSKVRYSRSKSNVSRVNTNSRDVVSKTDDRIDKLADQISNLVEIVNKQVLSPASAKAVEKTGVTYGGAHAYYDCIATDSNQPSVYAAAGSYNQVSPPNRVSHQIPPPGFAPVQNNPNRGNNFQNNKGYRAQMNNAPNFQNQGFQNQPFLVPNNQIPPSVPNELSSYIKSNEIAIKSMQNQINVLRGDFNKQEENLRRNLKDDMSSILSSFFQNQPLTSGNLLSNTVPNPKGEMKAVTTRSGLAYKGPSIPTNSPLEKVDEQNIKEILDKEHSNSSGNTAQPTIPYPSRLNDQKLREKATNQMEKFFQIFLDLHFDISFADALLLMPKFASTIKSLLANKDKLFELAKVPLNKNCSAMLLRKLLEKLGDTADPRVPLILGRSFLRTGLGLIDVYREEITLRVNDESVTFNFNQVIRYSDNSVSRINVINIACEEFIQDNTKSSTPTLISEKGDILFIEKLLNDDPCQLPSMDLKVTEESKAKSPIEEPEYSLSMGEYEVISDNESEYNEPIKDDSFLAFTTFTNPLFNDKDDFTSNDNESIHDEDVSIKESKVYSNPLFDDDEIYSNELESHELHVDNSIPNSENELSDNEASDFDDPSFPRPPPEPPDVEFDFKPNSGGVISDVMNNNDELYDDECFNPGGEIDILANVEDGDYFPFIFFIRIFLPYFIYPKVFPLLLSAESKDTIFNPGKDYAKTVENQSKSGNIRHEIESLHQKPDQKASFCNNQANEAKCQKNESSRAILANFAKLKSKEK
uniref:Reverse transcriptase domain-containing protein n=1 Tax=Tanacetum cinerariifolium TaxID=118510 RepID=A0A6L2JPH2_TANCI|nr:reverse transcriptase domain-containing protein [Tanacetum cinerariifolium]